MQPTYRAVENGNGKVFGIAWNAMSRSHLFLHSFVDEARLEFSERAKHPAAFRHFPRESIRNAQLFIVPIDWCNFFREYV